MRKALLFVLIVAAVLCSYPGDAVGHPNRFFVGVSLNLSTGGVPNLGSIRPWVQARISQSTRTDVNRFRINEVHHLYLGSALWVVGKITDVKVLRVVGGVLVIDDAIQHIFRVNSPVHLLNDELYRHQWYQDLVKEVQK